MFIREFIQSTDKFGRWLGDGYVVEGRLANGGGELKANIPATSTSKVRTAKARV